MRKRALPEIRDRPGSRIRRQRRAGQRAEAPARLGRRHRIPLAAARRRHSHERDRIRRLPAKDPAKGSGDRRPPGGRRGLHATECVPAGSLQPGRARGVALLLRALGRGRSDERRRRLQQPRAFGFYPWIDATKAYYGIVARHSLATGAYVDFSALARRTVGCRRSRSRRRPPRALPLPREPCSCRPLRSAARCRPSRRC